MSEADLYSSNKEKAVDGLVLVLSKQSDRAMGDETKVLTADVSTVSRSLQALAQQIDQDYNQEEEVVIYGNESKFDQLFRSKAPHRPMTLGCM